MSSVVAVFGLGKYQKSGILELKKRNFFIIGFDEKNSPYSKKSVDKFFNVSFNNIKKIQKICKENKVKYLFAFSTDAPLNLISKLNENLKLQGYKKKDVNLISDKIKLRKFFKKKMKISQPKFNYFQNFDKISKKKFDKFKKPIVCKPNVGSGSKGVFFANNYSNFLELFKENKSFYKNKKILIENFIHGTEYAIEGWIYNNKFILGCLSKKKRSNLPYLLDISLIINYKNSNIISQVNKFFHKFIKKTNMNNLPIHFEFLIRNNRIVPIDFAIRGAGFSVYSKILSKIMQQSTNNILVNLIMNLDIEFNKPNDRIFFLRFLFSNKDGIFKGITNLKKLKKLSSFRELQVYKKKDSKVSALKNGQDRIGHFILENSSKNIYKDVLKSNNLIKTKIQYE